MKQEEWSTPHQISSSTITLDLGIDHRGILESSPRAVYLPFGTEDPRAISSSFEKEVICAVNDDVVCANLEFRVCGFALLALLYLLCFAAMCVRPSSRYRIDRRRDRQWLLLSRCKHLTWYFLGMKWLVP
ncbi:uncharacterized protein EAF01_007636 [Botrytis porri]|uniref:uncharacterized protein n=1 Tax=Botrytis porri TaxID=87229 RepID=UPI0019010F7E|nr:uncharacterized protein EAF01_007636 [Botrytis porri]KAF7900334.1 hypothetical protein EAF01_007636 [Botrytis porri]